MIFTFRAEVPDPTEDSGTCDVPDRQVADLLLLASDLMASGEHPCDLKDHAPLPGCTASFGYSEDAGWLAERAAIIEVLSEFAPLALPHNDLPTIVRGLGLQRENQRELKDHLAEVARKLTEDRRTLPAPIARAMSVLAILRADWRDGYGPETVPVEVARALGVHMSYVPRVAFEGDIGRAMTDEEWQGIEDRYDDYIDYGAADVAEYRHQRLDSAGWTCDDNGIWHPPTSTDADIPAQPIHGSGDAHD